MSQAKEFELAGPPTDGITRVAFSRTADPLLIASSWDRHVRLYDVVANQQLARFEHRAPVLDCCFGEDQRHAFSGGLDRRVRILDLTTKDERELGKQDDAVRSVVYLPQAQLLATGSWDKTVRLYDTRAATAETSRTEQPAKVFALDAAGYTLVAAMAERHVHVYDVRNMSEPMQRRESSLKYQTRAIACMHDGEGYLSSSIEGRVAVEFFDPSPKSQARKYAFKCHRATVNGVDTVYPVNALAFHPIHGTFATGGGDGGVSVWDGMNKKRVTMWTGYPTSVASLAFSSDGRHLAIAASYTYEEGDKDHPPDTIFIRTLEDSDIRPKRPAPGK
ncbi:WD40-repeat-containing domain protein [Thamnocephalis sphaerospora]|uniref:WD40-repeat-containing domain protein n=1 Tax=Thamnocephalis sphaerospora TaxID=78915 RepID=A0A4P9XQ57_9FUNG|nr:WD40-repeat-containing domain protein [Thamnocephalis sphaerospora]|eukprot:RKP08163.1 WD40-repeat-containing domain protein [Thamnocephalis sphaerospora]